MSESIKIILGFVCLVVGWIGLAIGNIVWFVKFVYELIKTDVGFWSITFSNLGGWLLTIIVSIILLVISYTFSSGK